ncbi:MAG: mechanosensitive ion channel family protein [Polyangiales bacterium]
MESLLTLLAQTAARATTSSPATSAIPFRALALASPLERLGVAADVARWIEKATAVALVIALSMLALRLVPWVERKVLAKAKESVKPHATESEIDLRQRVETLTRVVTSLTRAAVISLAIVMVLGELGMEIKPLLAGAGIAGIAVGFGAQSIVKDFFAGFFILLEDQYDVGDTVTIGSVTGTVEQMTLRVTVLRDANGTAYFIPNSSITQVANKTHGWARAAVDLSFRSKVRVGLARDILDAAAKHAKTFAPLSENESAEIKTEGPLELDWGGTKWTLAVRAPATQVAAYKRALIEAIHHVLHERGFEADDTGRLGPN